MSLARSRRLWPLIALVTALIAVALVAARVWDDAREPATRVAVVEPLAVGSDGLALPKAIGSLRLAVIGDTGRGDAAQYDTALELHRWHTRFDFGVVLMLGDNIYGPGTPEDYALRFERPYKPLLDEGVTFQAALGNHDPPGQQHYAPFNMQGQRYYTFVRELGLLKAVAPVRVQFFAIDTVTLDAAQLQWLEKELAASPAEWKIAFYHHPLYTSGRYRLAAGRVRRSLEPLFVRFGVDVGLSGHEHFYERVIPQQGVLYFTSGAGGALRVDDLRASTLTAAGFDDDTHFLLLEITGSTLYFQAISRTGRTVDAGRLERARNAALPPSLRK